LTYWNDDVGNINRYFDPMEMTTILTANGRIEPIIFVKIANCDLFWRTAGDALSIYPNP